MSIILKLGGLVQIRYHVSIPLIHVGDELMDLDRKT